MIDEIAVSYTHLAAISSFGGKAVFVEEIEEALLSGTIDLAVHSAKDMPNPRCV